MAMAQSRWIPKKPQLPVFVEPMFHLHDTEAILLTDIKKTNANINGLSGGETHGNANHSFCGINVRRLYNPSRLKEAINKFHVMDKRGIPPDSSKYSSLLEGCINAKDLPQGKLLHAHLIHSGFNAHICLRTKLVIMYTKCGSLRDARRVLDEMPESNLVSFNVMIASYGRHGRHEDALALFYEMQQRGAQPNAFTFSSVLTACANLAAIEHGKKIHEDIINLGFLSNIFVRNALVDMYVKCRRLDDGRQVFDKMPDQNAVSWTTMIAGYAQNGHVDEALKLFRKMPERDVVSWNAMIAGYTQNRYVDEALMLFQKMPVRNVVSWNTMIAGYEQNGHVDEALKLFKKMPQRDEISWNAMITGHAQNGHIDEALKLFQKMPQQDVVSWNSLITAYAQKGHVEEALKLFQKMPERDCISWNSMIAGYAQNARVDAALKLFQNIPEQDVVCWNAMIAGYARNGHFDEAQKLFQKMPERDVVSWNTMITGYEQNRCFEEALELFNQMQLTDVKPVPDTFSSVLPACANLSALKHGKEVHKSIIQSGLRSHVFVASALVDMYAKCGSIDDACQVFDEMPKLNVVSWNVMIMGYAMHGCGREALQLFEQMQHFGMRPDHITFVGVLSACCHAGLVNEGWQHFDCMSRDYHITPTVEHYGCMVDLLGRAGRLNEAQCFIDKMPIKPSAVVWRSLLGSCRIHMNLEQGEFVAKHLFELEPEKDANYVLLSNIYAVAGRWDDVEKLQKMRKDRKIRKNQGCSWIEINNKVYSFPVRDRSHLQTQN